MSLPAPNLDDRTFNDIKEEAKELIAKFCPQWTDFNESDPGITLVELMAWMTEMMIYRLNRLPEKNYIKFLELMGVTLKTPQPSKAWVVFTTVSGVKEEDLPFIPSGTKISTGETTDEPIVFETMDLLNLTDTHIVKIFSKYKEKYTDHETLLTEEVAEGVSIFSGEKYIPHILYLGDVRMGIIGKDSCLKLYIALQTASILDLNFEWEYWDGNAWNIIIPSRDDTCGMRKDGNIYFESLPSFEEKVVDDISCFWLRARLIEMGGTSLPEFKSIKRAFELKPDYRLNPDMGFITREKETTPIDFSMDFYPFGKEPRQNDIFTISSEVFSKKEAMISIYVTLSEDYSPKELEFMTELEVRWEYYTNEQEWELFCISDKTGTKESKHGFKDDTEAFTHSGVIRFICPDDIVSSTFEDKENFWIRARLTKGNYGTMKKTRAPVIKSFKIRYEEKSQDFEYYLSHNYLSYKELTSFVKEQKPFEPFKILSDEDPTLYLGFNSPFSNKLHRLYFRLADQKEITNSRICWEYRDNDGWKELTLVKDSTHVLSRNGAIEFLAPTDWIKKALYGESCYWLRGRWESGIYSTPPEIIGVQLNAVETIQAVSIPDEILGSSNGEPYQIFEFSNSPILPNPTILVKERENASSQEITRFRETLHESVVTQEDKVSGSVALWSRWKEVQNFFNSKPEDRHYTLDHYNSTISFGDGKRGKIPPSRLKDNIKCEIYYVGGGSIGNVRNNTISILETSFPSIEAVGNPDPATGGADAETIENAKLRGPWSLKHRHRAVTLEDFEKLSLEASGEVAKAKCFTEDGDIKLIILPKGSSDILQPGIMLIQKIKKFLDERRLITTKLTVTGPEYIKLSIKIKGVVRPQKVERIPEIKIKMANELKLFLHPLKGGPSRNGWPMGRTIHISEIYHTLEKIEGVDYIDRIILNNNPFLQKIAIGKMNYPHLKSIKIEILCGE
ncbi:MAG: putative baseplate assembly protein [Deltaproteobacteria bacterium]|nr:putative baseplate assembly protein [Deltaproteobacteria bacterium]